MPVIYKKCFLFHYDPSINSDKVFNLFLLDNEDETYSTLQEHGRSGTKLRVLPLVENCSLALAQSRYSAKLNEKVYHSKTPYKHTLNAATSPTYKKFGAEKSLAAKPLETAKIIDFKSAEPAKSGASLTEKQSGKQKPEVSERHLKRIGVLNLGQLDALEF